MTPIVVSMMMYVGISPEVTQILYRIGDSPSNIITPNVALLRARPDLPAEVLQEGLRGHPDVALPAVCPVHADRRVHLLHHLALPRHSAGPRLTDGYDI